MQANADSQSDGNRQPGTEPQRDRSARAGRDGEARAIDDLRQFLAGEPGTPAGPGDEQGRGPITGDGFRDWSDRLRDVEEMVGDPQLRAEAARIRERARGMRAEFTRHSKEPNWGLVREFVGRPLVELRDAVADEVMRRQTAEAMVPIDREPVPPQYVDKVKEYYERLGSGR